MQCGVYRYDRESKTMLPRFELFLDYDIKLPEEQERDTNWALMDWADYMDPDAMTTLLEDAICNLEEEEYQEACQHALKNPYEAGMDNEDDEEGGVPNDDNEGSGSEDSNNDDNKGSDSDDSDESEDSDGRDNSSDDSDNEGSDNEDYDIQDNNNDRGETLSDREDEDAGAFYEDNSYDEGDYYDKDIEDDAEAVRGDYDEYPYGRPLDWSCIRDVSPKLGP